MNLTYKITSVIFLSLLVFTTSVVAFPYSSHSGVYDKCQFYKMTSYSGTPGSDCIAQTESSEEQKSKAILSSKAHHILGAYTDQIKAFKQLGGFSLVGRSYLNSGLNAGDDVASGIGLWFSPAYTSIKNTAAINHISNFTGDQQSYLFGADMIFNPNFMAGALVGYETSGTRANDNSENDSDGYIISAYAAYNFKSGFTAYGHIAYDYTDTDVEDRNITGNTATYDGSYDSDSYLLGFGVMRTTQLDNDLLFTMDLAYNYAYTGAESYNARHSVNGNIINMRVDSSRLSDLFINTELAKSESWGEYYATLGAVVNLYNKDDIFVDNNAIGINAGLGMRFTSTDNFLGDISFNKVFLKKGEEDYTFTMNFRYNF